MTEPSALRQTTTVLMPPPRRPFLTFGLPFLAFMVLGHRGLAYIGQGRYDVSFQVKNI